VTFDRYITVDWSASKTPRQRKDSIWVCMLGRDGEPLTENPDTRGHAEAFLGRELRESVAQNERVLIGFDFPYAFPSGLAASLSLDGPPWCSLWEYFTSRIKDDPGTNMNNRFHVADEVNACLGRPAFWGQDPNEDPLPSLPRKRDPVAYPARLAELGLTEWRRVEQIIRDRRSVKNPRSAWQLWGAASEVKR
jgi:hypothetical protein